METDSRFPTIPPQSRYQPLVQGLLSACREIYGPRLVTVALYGSVARGTARPDSDLDLLLVAEDLPQGRMRRIREFSGVEDALAPELQALEREGCSCALSPVIKTSEEVDAGSLLFLDMTTDAVLVYDRGDYFAAVLRRLEARLTELGARKVVRGNAWYWDLKPDYRPGEEIKLW